MKNLISTTLLMAMFTTMAFSQQLKQTVRGVIIDTDSKLPLIGTTVSIAGTNPPIATSTDATGKFRLENVAIGRITLQLSYIGYEPMTIPNIEVTSGKEVVLDLSLKEAIVKMDEVVVKSIKRKGEALNEMAMVSSRSISVEETGRYSNSWSDPSRVVSNFAGVASNPDGASFDIIVRGNSPKYLQWRLDGVEISSPYHFNDQNSSNGGLSALNNKLLSASDFYTGAFSPEYGNALSSIMDVRLRTGNNEKFEAAGGIGLLGTDLTLEGPFKKGYAGSYLINYRYSTITLLNKLGLVDLGEMPDARFQDLNFKVVLPTKNAGTFSIFGLGGLSGTSVKGLKNGILTTPGSQNKNADIRKNYDKSNFLSNLGINHVLTINKKSVLKTSLSYSSNGISDDIFEYSIINSYNNPGEYLNDSTTNKINTFKNRITYSTYRAALTFNSKLNAKNRLQIGTRYSLTENNYDQSLYSVIDASMFSVEDFRKNVSIINNFISWKYSFNDQVSVVSGLHNMNVLLNNKSTLEPRIGINWQLNNSSSINAGYGMHSTMESIHNYFTKVQQIDGSVTEPNTNLDLLKAHHFVLGYKKRITNNVTAKLEVYYQYLYNLPVEDNDSSNYATINEGIDYRYVALVNKGKGKNIGAELTIERFFNNNYYYLISASLFDSKYKTLDGVWRNTQYNSNYLVNILGGKEFKNIGRKQNKSLAINVKVFFGGGKRYIPLLRDANGNVTVDPAKDLYWDYKKAYDKKLENIYQVNISVGYKINKPKATHEILLDFGNITNFQPKISEYYDESKPGKVGYIKAMTAFPNLMYRVYF
jgi:hypothetical protein